MLHQLKLMLGIEDASQDEKLLYILNNAITQVEEYIHDTNIDGLDGIIVQLAAYNYSSGLFSGQSSGGTSGGVSGEIKKESYSGVTYEYTTSADFTSSSSSAGESNTYFAQNIAPLLRGRRKMRMC